MTIEFKNRDHRESMHWVDATPDEDYPIRILQAHLEGNENTYCVGYGEGPEELARWMNEAQEKRAEILRRAIALLREGETPCK